MAFYTETICVGNYKIKISSTDTTPDYLLNKLVPGTNVTITQVGTGGNETLVFASTSGGFSGLQEKSTTTPNGVLTTFAFAHTPLMILYNGQVQLLTTDYTVSSNNVSFVSIVPQTGDTVSNVYA